MQLLEPGKRKLDTDKTIAKHDEKRPCVKHVLEVECCRHETPMDIGAGMVSSRNHNISYISYMTALISRALAHDSYEENLLLNVNVGHENHPTTSQIQPTLPN